MDSPSVGSVGRISQGCKGTKVPVGLANTVGAGSPGRKAYLEGVRNSPSPVILREVKNLHMFVFKKIKADSSLRSE
jgi:hypothetical protein